MLRFQIFKEDLSKQQIKSLLSMSNIDWDIYEDDDVIVGESQLDDESTMVDFLFDDLGIDGDSIDWS